MNDVNIEHINTLENELDEALSNLEGLDIEKDTTNELSPEISKAESESENTEHEMDPTKNESEESEEPEESEEVDELKLLEARVAKLESIAAFKPLSSQEIQEIESFLAWANKREKIQPNDPTFYVYEEAILKAKAMLVPLKEFISPSIWPLVFNNCVLHYIIVENYSFQDGEDNELINPLYQKYNIAAKAYIVSSASDESSSSSIHVTKSLSDGDFTMQDLMRTKYGEYVYTILEQIDASAVLL